MDIVIRRACLEDVEGIARLNRDEMGYDYAPDKTRARLEALLDRADHCIYVAVLGGEVVGYVHANDHDVVYGDHRKNIMGIAVSAHHKRMGIGGRLLDAVEAWGKAEGAAGVRLVSGSGREDAHRFYEARGYRRNKEQLSFSKGLEG